MTVALIVIASLTLLLFGIFKLNYLSRKGEYSDWEIGDVLILSQVYCDCSAEATKVNGSNVAKLVGWSRDKVYIKIGDITYEQKYIAIEFNKSAKWRRRYNECKETMGKDPGFSPSVGLGNRKSATGEIDGQPIDTMNETLCQIYLKKAIEEEDYRTAELIRKRLQNFR